MRDISNGYQEGVFALKKRKKNIEGKIPVLFYRLLFEAVCEACYGGSRLRPI